MPAFPTPANQKMGEDVEEGTLGNVQPGSWLVIVLFFALLFSNPCQMTWVNRVVNHNLL